MRSACVATAIVAAMTLAACVADREGAGEAATVDTSTTTAMPGPASPVTDTGDRVEVVESGWSVYGYPAWMEDQEDRFAATYGMLVSNPGDKAAQSITVRSRFLDAGGHTLGPIETETTELLLPGQTIALGRSGVDISAGTPEGHEVLDVEVGGWLDVAVEPGGFEVDAAESLSTELMSEDAQFSAMVQSTFVAPVSEVAVTALVRGVDGRITGGVRFTEPDTYRFEPRQWLPVYTELLDATGLEAATTEVYPRLTTYDPDAIAFLPPPPPPGHSGSSG